MSRLKHFTRSLISGYAVLVANTIFTLASIPIALHYLPPREFGVWAVASQIAGYMALIDLGITGALGRTLIDFKDDRNSAAYGSMIVASALVSITQALLILFLSLGLGPLALPFLRIPSELSGTFTSLILWQGAVVALGLMTRISSVVVTSHHRFDILNYAQVASVPLNFGVTWICFESDRGVFSLMYGQVAAVLLVAISTSIACFRLRLLPARSAYRQPTWVQFKELFSFSKDVFGYSLGTQLINASQTLIITRVLGLDAGAVWSICMRTYSLLLQIIHRVFDYSISALSEMLVRQEQSRLFERFRDLTVLSTTLAVAGGILFATTNTVFIKMWTNNAIVWSAVNDALLAVLCIVSVVQRAHTALLGVRKHLRFVKYIYVAEGACFIATALVVAPRVGLAGVLLCSLVCTCLFSLTYNLRQTTRYFRMKRVDLLQWFAPGFRCALVLAPCAAAIFVATLSLNAPSAFFIRLLLVGSLAAVITWRSGTPEHLKRELARRLKLKVPQTPSVGSHTP